MKLSCPFCRHDDFLRVFVYHEAPQGETSFFEKGDYFREVFRCRACAHFLSRHNMDMTRFYRKVYVQSTYGSGGLEKAFRRIEALPPEKSDNRLRVERLMQCLAKGFQEGRRDLLDVGSGLGVFPHRMREAGWRCTALDPDEGACRHLKEVLGFRTIQGLFGECEIKERFDLITFNKILEHVEDPLPLLKKAGSLLNSGGRIYLELPDGEGAFEEGPGREEFFIEHVHVFSQASLKLFIEQAGFFPEKLQALREPSGKYTLWALLRRGDEA
jgi:2-polyprenyl-3-methyl-5-hydroxy-6-metoxy-1,4-benzoquinol methylase